MIKTDYLNRQLRYYPELEGHLIEIIEASKKIHKDRALIEFTDHGFEHSNRVQNAICEICKGSSVLRGAKNEINPYEAFVLIAAVYLHDIGMQINDKIILNKFSKEYKIPIESDTETFVRQNHHLLSSYWIKQNIQQNPAFPLAFFGEKELGEFVELVVSSHGQDFTKNEQYTRDYTYHGSIIRLDMLCSLLSLGDALDCDCRRIDYEKLKYSEINLISKMHRLKHYYVDSVIFNKKQIQISYKFPLKLSSHEKSIYTFFFTALNSRWINYCCDNYNSILQKYDILPSIEEAFTFSTAKDVLNREEYTFIEEKTAEMVAQNYGEKAPVSINSMRVAIGVLIHDKAVLLVKRKKKEGPLEWQFPAGIIKPNEEPTWRMIKEFQDETGIQVEVDRLIGNRIHPDTKALCYYYSLRYISGDLVNGDEEENSEAKWVPLSEYKEYITSDIYYRIEQFIKGS